MKTEIYVQARMGSTRLPGKVLKPILGKPMLFYLLERLKRVKHADAIRVLTSTLTEDQAIVDFCKKQNMPVERGPSEDVLTRYHQAAKKHHPDTIVRITGDCPLIDPTIVDQAIEEYNRNYPHFDYISNSLERTFPRGLDTEVFSKKALETAFREASQPSEREHVTLYMYRHPEQFALKNIPSPTNLAHHRWTVDTPEDFALITKILEALYPKNPAFTTQDILHLLQLHPTWSLINAKIHQKEL